MDDMNRKFFKTLFSQPSAGVLSSLLSKAIHMGSAPGTITFSYQIATSILDAILSLYAHFVDLNRFCLAILLCFHDCQLVFSFSYACIFYFCSTAFHTAHNSVACTSVTCF